MSTDLPLADVSVIIPCYRCSDTIGRAVASIAAQTQKPSEVILIEDCSGDNTLDTLYQLQASYEDEWIKVISLPQNSGPGTARNAGWALATSRYLALLDADDSWHPRKIELQYQWMMAHPEVVLSGHSCITVEDDFDLQALRNESITLNPVNVSKLRILTSNRFPTRTVMMLRDIKQRFKFGKRYSEDYLLWLQIRLADQQSVRFNNVLAYRYKEEFGAGGLSQKLWVMEKNDLENGRIILNDKSIGFPTYVFYSVYSLLKYVRKVLIVWLRKI